ncbi:MAG: protein-L-isoaspartate O-methyltransferase [Bauldia sp.]
MDGYSILRTRMVDSQLRTQSVTDPDVLAAMGEVPRERFVPPPARPLAYIDKDLLIKPAAGDAPARYLMEPAPLARLLQLAEIGKTDIVLVVGCGSGYSAAVLARLADSVVALESDPELAEKASATLVELGVGNVAVVSGPAEDGYPAEGPYDVIFIDGAVAFVPEALRRQLKQAGRLVAVVGYGRSAPAMVYTRSGDEIAGRAAFDAHVQPLPGFRKPAAFVF